MRPNADWAGLSKRGKWIRDEIARPVSDGEDMDQIAARLNMSRRTISRLMDELQAEIRAQPDQQQELPPLTPDEYDALRADIAERGVQVPIVVDEDGHVIDGHHRLRACRDLGVDCPRRTIEGLEDEEKRTLALTLNLTRRQVAPGQRRILVEAEIRRNPDRSDRQIAAMCGVSHPTVGAIRRELERRGDVERLSTRTDRTGRQQPATKPFASSPSEPEGIPESRDPGESTAPGVLPPPTPAPPGWTLVSLAAPDDEVAEWEQAAGMAGMELDEWIRRVANDAVMEV